MYMSLLRCLMKRAGVKSQAVEIEAGTVMRYWVPSDRTTTNKPNTPAVVLVHGCGLDGILTWKFEVGLSYGGIVCFKTAEMFPDSVESMVVVKGLKDSLLVATNKFPWLPDFAYKSVLEVVRIG
ncbi:hypothetical protein DKX38_006288 [Salix brachista]|uniref:Uncharacterized protein n=1 Tax=Salix brachista TaxID=2182728 RepID=A0A5N5N4E1_9ROSI|nr:hypothetical protein DKX38_006288 [Salix brachista]